MNKKLGRLLHPSAGVFFAMLMVFAAAAVLMEYYILAIGEFAVTAILLIGYLIHRKYRLKEIQKYLENDVLQHQSFQIRKYRFQKLQFEFL